VNVRTTALGGALVGSLVLGASAGPAAAAGAEGNPAVVRAPKPGRADGARPAALTVMPLIENLAVTDDDSTIFGTSTQMRNYTRWLDQRTLPVGQSTTWSYGACSGSQGDGEVWVQVIITAKALSSTTFQAQLHLDLYEDTSDACGGETVNYPLDELDHDGWADRTTAESLGANPHRNLEVSNILEGPTFDHGSLTMLFSSW